MKQWQKDIVFQQAIKTAEKNLTSGNWKVETARLYIQGAKDYPEMYRGHASKS